MELNRRSVLRGATSFAGLASLPDTAFGQTRAETLRYITGNNVNTLDCTVPGATREAFGACMQVYDRLFSFGRKRLGDTWVFDPSTVRGELARGYTISPDGVTITITLRPDATWHDGSPVTVEDVKWSLDRAVSAKSLAPAQMGTGSMTSPDQFRIVDDHTIEVTLPRPDRLGLANLCVPYIMMINSKVAKQHATADDPWALEWLKLNPAAGGAYTVESFRASENLILRRNEAWKGGENGALPYFRRIIIQTVPEPATRANLVEKGDADLAIDLAASDVLAMEKSKKPKVVSIPQTNGFTHISMNTQKAPFDNVKVRQAIAAALPYEDMFKAALFERGRQLFGADWAGQPPDGGFPQPMPFKTDPTRAKQLLSEAGMPEGFKTTFAFSTGQAATAEPLAALLKEALGHAGIQVDIQKMSDAEFSTKEAEKNLAFYTDIATAWLPATDYFFRIYFTRPNQRFNFASWRSPVVDQLTEVARFERDPTKYNEDCKQMIEVFAAQVPLIMLWQPNHDAVMAASVDGYTYQFYRQADFRVLRRV
jgi:peptide/nickel transport system substrate-binding protein